MTTTESTTLDHRLDAALRALTRVPGRIAPAASGHPHRADRRVSLANAKGWLAAGAAGLGLVSRLTGDNFETGDVDALHDTARTWRREITPQ